MVDLESASEMDHSSSFWRKFFVFLSELYVEVQEEQKYTVEADSTADFSRELLSKSLVLQQSCHLLQQNVASVKDTDVGIQLILNITWMIHIHTFSRQV